MGQSKAKKLFAEVFVSSFTEDVKDDKIKQIFDTYDIDNNQILDEKEFSSFKKDLVEFIHENEKKYENKDVKETKETIESIKKFIDHKNSYGKTKKDIYIDAKEIEEEGEKIAIKLESSSSKYYILYHIGVYCVENLKWEEVEKKIENQISFEEFKRSLYQNIFRHLNN